VNLLDQSAVARRRKLAQDYVAAPHLQKADEERLWNACFEFWKALAAAYLRCIENAKADAPDDDEEVLVVMRAGHYMSIQSLSVQLNDTSYILQPAGLIEGGEDFDCARFKMVRA
jgi:hypothetical protein